MRKYSGRGNAVSKGRSGGAVRVGAYAAGLSVGFITGGSAGSSPAPPIMTSDIISMTTFGSEQQGYEDYEDKDSSGAPAVRRIALTLFPEVHACRATFFYALVKREDFTPLCV
jgi:hypothetical protein